MKEYKNRRSRRRKHYIEMTKRKNPRDLKRNNKACPPHAGIPHWNRNGQQYMECHKCFAFLGFTGKVKR